MRSATLAKVLAALFSGLMFLSACTVVEAPPPPRPGPGPGPNFCSREYRPVCARRHGEQRTFQNACLADRAGFTVTRPGECRRPQKPQRACTLEYVPVCARRGNTFRTFGNACAAEASGWQIVRNRAC